MTKYRYFVAFLVGCACMTFTTSALATGWKSTTLEAAASDVAGRPIQVWCEDSIYDWVVSHRVADAAGYWNPYRPDWIFLGPGQCETLLEYLQLRKADEVGIRDLASALLTLAHEATHARLYGGDEGLVDCTAMPLVRGLAVRFFGMPESIASVVYTPVVKTVTIRVKVKVPKRTTHGVTITSRWKVFTRDVSTMVEETETLPNPDLQRLTDWLVPLHRQKPAAYQGNC